MNKELNQEAENFAEDTVKQCIKSNAHCDEGSLATGFIGGATSKYVEKQKLEFAIEQIKEIDKKCFGGSNTCKAKIKKLEQKLKEL